MEYKEKCNRLKEIIQSYAREDIMIAFSGGVDSSLLLALACDAARTEKRTVYAVTLHTMLHPIAELEEAKKIANSMGAEHLILQVDELSEADIMMNPKDRCYRCKKCLFQKMVERARKLEVHTILEGTNADDLNLYRPGIQAVKELGIRSPLAEAEMTKEEVRRLAAEYKVTSSNKPSTPCLATRFPYDTQLSYDKMKKVEAAELFLKRYNFYNVRVRVHDKLVRIEVDQDKLDEIISNKDRIVQYMNTLGYQYVTIDLEGFRSGSYDI